MIKNLKYIVPLFIVGAVAFAQYAGLPVVGDSSSGNSYWADAGTATYRAYFTERQGQFGNPNNAVNFDGGDIPIANVSTVMINVTDAGSPLWVSSNSSSSQFTSSGYSARTINIVNRQAGGSPSIGFYDATNNGLGLTAPAALIFANAGSGGQAGAGLNLAGATTDMVTIARYTGSAFTAYANFSSANGLSFPTGPSGANVISVAGSQFIAYATGGGMKFNSQLISQATAPTISSGFGTSPSVTGGFTSGFRINVGTGGAASSGVIGLPATSNGWNCFCNDLTTRSATVFLCKQTASSTNSATIGNFDTTGAAAAWAASDIIAVNCMGY
jgi:hypothetical protein